MARAPLTGAAAALARAQAQRRGESASAASVDPAPPPGFTLAPAPGNEMSSAFGSPPDSPLAVSRFSNAAEPAATTAAASPAAALALATGGTVSHDGERMSVSFPGPAPAQTVARQPMPGGSTAAATTAPTSAAAAPATASTFAPVTVARAPEAVAEAPAESVPAAAASATAPAAPAAAAAAQPIDPDELYEQIMRRLRREVLHERELRGELF